MSGALSSKWLLWSSCLEQELEDLGQEEPEDANPKGFPPVGNRRFCKSSQASIIFASNSTEECYVSFRFQVLILYWRSLQTKAVSCQGLHLPHEGQRDILSWLQWNKMQRTIWKFTAFFHLLNRWRYLFHFCVYSQFKNEVIIWIISAAILLGVGQLCYSCFLCGFFNMHLLFSFHEIEVQ